MTAAGRFFSIVGTAVGAVNACLAVLPVWLELVSPAISANLRVAVLRVYLELVSPTNSLFLGCGFTCQVRHMLV